jgi:hypothetical protein
MPETLEELVQKLIQLGWADLARLYTRVLVRKLRHEGRIPDDTRE